MILTITLNAAIDKRYVTQGAIAGEVNRIKECTYTPGGKGLNVSKVLKISGTDVLASGLLGGYAGRYIESELQKLGIASDFYHVEGESRSCINIWDEKTKLQTEYLEPGFTASNEDAEGFFAKFHSLVNLADVITISGSVPNGISTDIYKDLVMIAKTAGKNVILDSSGELLKAGIQAKPTLIKPNIDEIRMLTGKPCNDTQQRIHAAKELHDGGIPYVVISLGAKGAVIVSDEGIYQAIVPEVDAVNTVGCGDAMVAGLAIGLSEKLSAGDMLKKASGISTAAAMNDATGYYKITDREKINEKIVIKQWQS